MADGWGRCFVLTWMDGKGFITIFKCLHMCYISVSMDVGGHVIQERESERDSSLISQSRVESKYISHIKVNPGIMNEKR